MARLISLLMVLALVLTNGASMAAAVCQHADARAHALALSSLDEGIAADARNEDSAARKAEQKGTLADAAAVQLAGFMLPAEPALAAPTPADAMGVEPQDARALVSRTISPLLDLPLA